MGCYIGIVDLGSNTARLAVYFQDDQGILYDDDNIKRVLRLSSYTEPDGKINQTGFAKALDCLRRFKELCDARKIDKIIGVATAAIRQAANGKELLKEIENQTGICFRLLSGEEEAYFGYLAVINSMNIENGLTIDIGGGSTEITRIQNRKISASVSFPFGIVTLTKTFLKQEIPTQEELDNLRQFLKQQFSSQPWLRNSYPLVISIGGTARNLAKMHQRKIQYSMASLHHYVMSHSDVDELWSWLIQLSLGERKKINGLSKDRADVIIAGVTVLDTLLEQVQCDQLITSGKGLRDGVLYNETLKNGLMDKEDVIMTSAEQFMSRYQVNKIHARHVRDMSVKLFDQFNRLNIIQFGDNERKLLEIASLLHDVGRSINIYEASLHTFYLLSNVLLLGLTHKERLLIAMIASYKNNKQVQQQIAQHKDILCKSDKLIVEQLGQIVMLNCILDRSMTQQVRQIVVKEMEDGEVRIDCISDKEDLMEYTLLEEVLEKASKVYMRNFSYKVKNLSSIKKSKL